jgi:hypothetical protein
MLQSMIPKSGDRFSEKIMLQQVIRPLPHALSAGLLASWTVMR